MNKVKWGIIGCGDVCETKSGPAFYKVKNSELVAVMRRDEDKAKDFAERHNVPKYYSDADKLIADPAVNAVYIATPPSTHKEYALKALLAGKPVYVEKPMALNFAECLEMIQIANKSQQKLFVAFYRRALPYFLKVKELLDNKSIGEVLNVDARYYSQPRATDIDPNLQTWRLDKHIAGGGYFFDMAPHTLDILDFLLGEIDIVKGYTKNLAGLYSVEDTVSAILRFKSGVLGTGQWCFVTDKSAEQDVIRITGTKGFIEFSVFAFTPIKVEGSLIFQTFEIERPEHIEMPLIQTIVNELRNWGTCPSTMASAARTARIMDIIMNIEAK